MLPRNYAFRQWEYQQANHKVNRRRVTIVYAIFNVVIVLAIVLAILIVALHGVVFINHYPSGVEVGLSFYVGSLS